MKKLDANLSEFLVKIDLDIFTLIFRWNLCLLLKEFPIYLSVKLIDYYLSSELEINELCVFLIAALLVKYSEYIQLTDGPKEKVMYNINNLPFHLWGFQDINQLVKEAMCLHGKLHLKMKKLKTFSIK